MFKNLKIIYIAIYILLVLNIFWIIVSWPITVQKMTEMSNYQKTEFSDFGLLEFFKIHGEIFNWKFFIFNICVLATGFLIQILCNYFCNHNEKKKNEN